MRVEAESDSAAGVFCVAGSRFGPADPLWGTRWWPPDCSSHVFARDVPSGSTRWPADRDRAGRPSPARREFRFPGAIQHISDRLTVTERPGFLHNVLGVRGRVEMLEEWLRHVGGGPCGCAPRAVALRVGRHRITLRGILRLDVDLVDGWDDAEQRRTIAMRATTPCSEQSSSTAVWYRHAEHTDRDAGAARGPGQYE